VTVDTVIAPQAEASRRSRHHRGLSPSPNQAGGDYDTPPSPPDGHRRHIDSRHFRHFASYGGGGYAPHV
jgi:hypothetical protein